MSRYFGPKVKGLLRQLINSSRSLERRLDAGRALLQDLDVGVGWHRTFVQGYMLRLMQESGSPQYWPLNAYSISVLCLFPDQAEWLKL